ncbi:hypothetical protein DPEC_G00100930 [Dallia pectoralis]|uniref:Uncharacterized protein n=1 Tax=Dallia pectoralis TaxID=75939 RepID=A0ACC2GW97_DALPE|nr:hypothetical protein DPEC_G00100930 [Dallia pectoralis]
MRGRARADEGTSQAPVSSATFRSRPPGQCDSDGMIYGGVFALARQWLHRDRRRPMLVNRERKVVAVSLPPSNAQTEKWL